MDPAGRLPAPSRRRVDSSAEARNVSKTSGHKALHLDESIRNSASMLPAPGHRLDLANENVRPDGLSAERPTCLAPPRRPARVHSARADERPASRKSESLHHVSPAGSSRAGCEDRAFAAP